MWHACMGSLIVILKQEIHTYDLWHVRVPHSNTKMSYFVMLNEEIHTDAMWRVGCPSYYLYLSKRFILMLCGV